MVFFYFFNIVILGKSLLYPQTKKNQQENVWDLFLFVTHYSKKNLQRLNSNTTVQLENDLSKPSLTHLIKFVDRENFV